jgi:hypothetical protein
MRTPHTLSAIVTVMTLLAASHLSAQTRSSDPAALRTAIEQKFDVLPISGGVALRPKDASRGVRSVEVASGPIAVDGEPVTGTELRDKFGADADVILELSYLSASERRALFERPAPSSTSTTAPPATSTPDISPRSSDPDPNPPPERRSRRGRSDDDRVHVGGSVMVNQDEVVEGDVVAIGGSARVYGTVRGAVVAVGGSVTLGPQSSVGDDVVVVGGVLHREPGAQVGGKISEVGIGALNFDRFRWSGVPFWSGFGRSAFAVIMTLMRVGILCLFTALVVMIGQTHMERAGARAAAEPLKSWAIGFLAQLLFLPIMILGSILIAITIIGIPLLFLIIPIVILGLCIIALVGFSGIAQLVGRAVAGRLNWSAENPYFATTLGVVVIMTPILLARLAGLGGGLMWPVAIGLGVLGFVIEYLAWTIGFGAMALLRFQRNAPAPAAPMGATPAVQT